MPRRRRRRMELNAEINVVSLIDVMLLLLVIFMITAPMMQGGVDISLPKAEAKPLNSKGGMVVTIDRDNEIFVDGEKMTFAEFQTAFAAIAKVKGREGLYLRADRGVNYGFVLQVLGIMNHAGVGDVGLIAEPEDSH